jgi:hypothetical protein
LSKQELKEIFQYISQSTESLKNIEGTIGDIKKRLEDGDKKFDAQNTEIQSIKLECTKRGVNCPSLHDAATPMDTHGIPMKYIGAGITFFAASMYGLVVVIAKLFNIDLAWPF